MRQARKDPSAELAPKCAWSKPLASFLGKAHVSDMYAIDGRTDDDFAPVWEADLAEKPYWAGQSGFRIHAVSDPDFNPDTMVLLAPDGSRCGFYSGGQVWVDADRRGNGLGAELVLAMAAATGRGPTSAMGGVGFSESGIAAHRKAWRLAVERAQDAGLAIDPWIAASAQSMAGEPAAPAPA